MHVSTSFRRHRPVLVAALTLAVLAASCSGGARPTLTGERLEETTVVAENVIAPTPVPEAPAITPDITSETETTAPEDAAGDESAEPALAAPESLVVEILETFPHDPTAFSQGLELFNGVFLESTGLYGESDIRRVDPATGDVLLSVPVEDQFFAEGLTRVDDQVIQLTWRENTALYWDATTLERTNTVSYEGEGWGLCFDGSRLIMTDGTPKLTFRDPVTFEEIGSVQVALEGREVFNLNEVECVNGEVWANIWQTDLIVRIDPATGAVTGLVDAVALDGPSEPQGAVLNGIAWDESTQSFYVTGKLWPTMYRVNFVPAPTG